MLNKAFTLLEVIFVIVVLAILAAVAIPRGSDAISSAAVSKLKSEVADIRSAISTKYSKNVLEGNDSCPELENGDSNYVFEGILTYPIKLNSSGIHWYNTENNYSAVIDDKEVNFTYHDSPADNCKFECTYNCSIIGE